MRVFNFALCTTVAAAFLAGCGSNLVASNSSMPIGGPQLQYRPESVYGDVAPPRTVAVLHSLVLPDKGKKLPSTGIYVSQFYASSLLGYAINNKKGGPICTMQGVLDVNDIAVDLKGNLIEPDGGTAYVNVYKGPQMCSTKVLGNIPDTVGQAADASSADAATGVIAVSNLANAGSQPGSVSLCTIKSGCTTDLTNSTIYHAGGVVMSPKGDCWDDAKTSASGGAALIYWAGCKGSGVVAKGFKSTYYGGVEMDNKGNLVIIDDMAETTTIYSGCNPKCKVVGGPFPLKGESFFGKLTSDNKEYIAVDRTDAIVDVYSYSTKSIKYMYSFSKGLSTSYKPDGIAINPRSKE